MCTYLIDISLRNKKLKYIRTHMYIHMYMNINYILKSGFILDTNCKLQFKLCHIEFVTICRSIKCE